jgi:hypothetical protein
MSDDLVTQQTRNSSREEIAVRAYQLWEERGRPIGSPEEDWSRAEKEIRGQEAAQEEWERARNEGVWARDKAARAHHASETKVPPFSHFGGSL